MFIICVLVISLIIFFYSYFYLKNDTSLGKYLFLMLYFILSIVIFIIRESLYSIYIGWDNLGISSYLLIAYYNNKNSLQSAIVTIIRNRVGDFIFLRIIVYLIYSNINSINLILNKFLSFFLFFFVFDKKSYISFFILTSFCYKSSYTYFFSCSFFNFSNFRIIFNNKILLFY